MSPLHAASSTADAVRSSAAPDISFRNEVQHSIDRGLSWLLIGQNTNGWWSTPDHPAVSALALCCFMGDPSGRYTTNMSPALTKGYDYILGCVNADGTISKGALANYNTAISMMALLAAKNPKYDDILRKGRAYLVKSQMLPESGDKESPFDGGVGYGDKYKHSDMNNTLYALEAIYHTRHLVKDSKQPAPDLNWSAAIQFLQNCQNLPSHNKQSWVSNDPKDQGGFVYYPGHSMAGGVTNATTGKVALRSYGSISYAGLLSYIYASLKKDDPRVKAVLNWLQANYSLQENPGMGNQGLYYYLHTLSKALNAAEVQSLQLGDGSKVDWRRETAMRLMNLQQADGLWVNKESRWWENDPNLVTAYSVLALEILYQGL